MTTDDTILIDLYLQAGINWLHLPYTSEIEHMADVVYGKHDDPQCRSIYVSLRKLHKDGRLPAMVHPFTGERAKAAK